MLQCKIHNVPNQYHRANKLSHQFHDEASIIKTHICKCEYTDVTSTGNHVLRTRGIISSTLPKLVKKIGLFAKINTQRSSVQATTSSAQIKITVTLPKLAKTIGLKHI